MVDLINERQQETDGLLGKTSEFGKEATTGGVL